MRRSLPRQRRQHRGGCGPPGFDHRAVGVLAEVRERGRLDAGVLEQTKRMGDITGLHQPGIGDEQRAPEAQIRRESAEALE